MAYAQNGQKPNKNIEYRENYEQEIEELSFLLEEGDSLFNMWSNAAQKYGRVDLNNHVVYPDENKMTHYGEAKVFDFVAEMLKDMEDFAKTSVLMQTLDPSQGSLFPLEFLSGYVSPHITYTDYLQRKIENYISTTRNSEENKRILDYKDFQNSFLNFISTTENQMLFSKAKYLISSVGDPAMSGLFVETKAFSHAEDLPKVEIVQDNNFPYFVELARRHGFFVDMNAPWRLVVDIRSCYTRNKLKKRGINNLVEFFAEYYTPSYEVDFTDMKDIFFGLWNSYCEIRPFVDNLKDTMCGYGIAVTERKKIPNIDDVSKLQWSKLYIKIRTEEVLKKRDHNYVLNLLDEVRFYFEEKDWESKVAKHVEKKLNKKVSSKTLTSSVNMYKIINEECPDIEPEEEIIEEMCEVGDDDMFDAAPGLLPHENTFPPDSMRIRPKFNVLDTLGDEGDDEGDDDYNIEPEED